MPALKIGPIGYVDSTGAFKATSDRVSLYPDVPPDTDGSQIAVATLVDPTLAQTLALAPEMEAALRGFLVWYARLPEPGLVPHSLELHQRLRETRKIMRQLAEARTT